MLPLDALGVYANRVMAAAGGGFSAGVWGEGRQEGGLEPQSARCDEFGFGFTGALKGVLGRP